ncbi:AAA family ATPase [Acetobacterium paludosum]|uniref:DNA 3'-5' helicase n=1 Tax=Acetobacterium paludosum TaxID=52693 RepID=A0A923KYM2_9FIRM|nr:ATP-dependent helicase [Acetobacterium paludosum]MBC3889851.1 AAA family ATPase [Acetobacterium paludosum]
MQQVKELEKLNDYQKAAVLDESEVCIVNAQVGSGKTTVLISKIIYLHHVKKISYRDMIVLTFTNKAANEIKERLIGADDGIQKEDLAGFGTFHSVALHFLKDVFPVEKMGYKKDFLVIAPDEELDIALPIIREKKLRIKYKNRLKKRLEQAIAIQDEAQKISPYQDDIFELIALLTEEKTRQNKMSFSDLIQNATALLTDDQPAPKWIIIDEVQDSDQLQLAFIDRLKGTDTKLFAVGDPNQIIYSWRGSTLNVFETLVQKYDASERTLPINYRSSRSILEAAKCFLKDGSDLTGIRETGSKIVVKNQYNPFNEACYLADRIEAIHQQGTPYQEIAIFYRIQNQSRVFEDVFLKNNIPYEVSLKKTIRDIPVLNWLIKLLRFSINHNDWSSGIDVLCNKVYGEKRTEKAALKILKEQAADQSVLFAKMSGFVSHCSEVKKPEEIYNYYELDRYIRPTASTYGEDKASIERLLKIIIDYVVENQMPFLEGLTDFINSSALYGINIQKKDIDIQADSVKLMTLHASKGLEFSYVFITGINYGLIPLHMKSPEEEAEERRLFFVGMTRAKDVLELSFYTNPDDYRVIPGESRYINMIPPQLVENQLAKPAAAVNLQELKKQIQAAKVEDEQERSSTETKTVIEEPERQVRHQKYGIGKVIREDELMIEAEFEHYGIKEFIKAFSELEYL